MIFENEGLGEEKNRECSEVKKLIFKTNFKGTIKKWKEKRRRWESIYLMAQIKHRWVKREETKREKVDERKTTWRKKELRNRNQKQNRVWREVQNLETKERMRREVEVKAFKRGAWKEEMKKTFNFNLTFFFSNKKEEKIA